MDMGLLTKQIVILVISGFLHTVTTAWESQRGESSLIGTGSSSTSLSLSSGSHTGLTSFYYGPVFVNEPPQQVSFSNDTGLWITCSAQASPTPQITWIEDSSGLPLMAINGLREIFPNGTMHIFPFPVQNFRSDIHSGDYRCLASNPVGTVISRRIRFRGVVTGNWKPVLENVAVARGNVVPFVCRIEENSRDFLSISGWSSSTSFTPITSSSVTSRAGQVTLSSLDTAGIGFLPIIYGPRYALTSNGDLLVSDTNGRDFQGKFRCQVTHELTGEIRHSNPAQLHITDAQRNEPVKLVYASSPTVKVQEGEEAKIGCVVHGNPPPSYRWFRRDRESSNSLVPLEGTYGTHLLSIPRASLSDSGIYVCIASNPFGELRRDFAIQVTSPLSLHVSPQRQEVNSGSDVIFNCSVTGHPVNEVRWLKDGKRIFPNSDRIRNPTQQVLHISSVSRDDQGMYQCFAFNDHDMAQAAAQLTVSGEIPVFRYTFIEQTVSAGSYVSLKCVIRGYPTPQASWLIDHETVRGEDVLSSRMTYGSYLDRNGDVITHLNLSHVTPQDGGEFSCTGKNPLGHVSHQAWLNVFGNPVAKSLKNITAVAGLPTKLNCPVGGYPLHSFQWTRYPLNTPIPDILYLGLGSSSSSGPGSGPGIVPGSGSGSGSSSGSGSAPKGGLSLPSNLRQKVDATGSLHLDHIERAMDEGIYICEAENKQGRSAQGALILNVIKPPEIAPFQFPSNLREGMRAQVSCSIISGDLPIIITWYKDHQIIQSGDIQTIQQQHEFASNLLFTNITADHNGLYTCLAMNDAASTNYTARLIVKVEPAWTREPHDLNIRKGVSAYLACQASGYPEPTIAWMKATGNGPKDFIPLSYNQRVGLIVTPNGTLNIQNADEHHEGHYLCQATNGIGPGRSKVVFIKVDVPAYFRVREVNQTARVGEDILLICDVEGDLPIQVSWGSAKIHSFLDDKISSAEKETKGKGIIRNTAKGNGLSSELHIKNIARDQSDTYYCRATNSYGGDTLAIHLRVKERPGPPKEVIPGEVGSRAVSLKLTGGHDGGSRISRFIAQYKYRNEEWRLGKNFTLESAGSTPDVHFLLRDLRPSQTYNIRLFAVNEIGVSDPSREIIIETLDEAPTGPPLDVLAESNSSTSIILTWNAPLEVHMNGKILGYQISLRESSSGSGGGGGGSSSGGPEGHNHDWRGWTQKESEARLVVFRKLHPFTRYEVTIQAFNRIGSGPASPRIIVLTSEGVPSGAPTDVKCVAMSGRSLRLRWSPPPHNSRNGHIVGYKVHYHLISRATSTPPWPMFTTTEVKRTTNPETNFSGLSVFGNYSIRISAYNRKGNGLSTLPIYCNTAPEAPSPPEAVKVLVTTSTSLIVSWLPPRFPNGIISKYNVYVRSVDTREVRVNTVHVGKRESSWVTEAISWELRGLREEASHEVWITAVNSQNSQMEGEPSPSAIQITSTRVGARIIPFGQEVFLPAGKGIIFSCGSVGLPAPTRTWTFRLKTLALNSTKWTVMPNGNLQIFATASAEVGNYTCHVENIYGKDAITYTLKLRSQPSLPHLLVTEKLHNQLTLQWEYREVSLKPTDLYLKWREKSESGWRTIYPEDDESFYTLTNLTCGSTYQILVGYYDGIQHYFQTKPIEATTLNQGLPNMPQEDVLVRFNSTAAALRFSRWIYTDCPAFGVSIEMREKSEGHWELVHFSHTSSLHTEYLVSNLKSSSRYEVRVVGENWVGKQTAGFTFDSSDPYENKATQTWNGIKNGANDPFQNDISNFLGQDGRDGETSSSWDLHVVVPIISGIICTLAMIVCLGVVIQRRRYMGYRAASHNKSKSSLTEFYGTVMRPCSESDDGSQLPSAANNQVYFATPQRKLEPFVNQSEEEQGNGGGGETYYEICPYATFSMHGPGSGGPGHPPLPLPLPLANNHPIIPLPNNSSLCLETSSGNQIKNFNHVGNSYYCQMPETRKVGGVGGMFGVGGVVGASKKDFHRYSQHPIPSLHGSNSDVFNLEISCISNQQTLPLGSAYDHQETSFDAYSLRRKGKLRDEPPSDSDEDDSRKPVPIRFKNRRDIQKGGGDSSTESAENSPLPAKRRGHHRSRGDSSTGHRRKKSLMEQSNSPRSTMIRAGKSNPKQDFSIHV